MTLIKQQPSCLKYKNDFSNLRVPDIIRVYHKSNVNICRINAFKAHRKGRWEM